jgi:hypothetical protein
MAAAPLDRVASDSLFGRRGARIRVRKLRFRVGIGVTLIGSEKASWGLGSLSSTPVSCQGLVLPCKLVGRCRLAKCMGSSLKV